MAGHKGLQESIEWSLYMSLLVFFPPVVLLLARGGTRLSSFRKTIVFLALLLAILYAIRAPSRFGSIGLSLAAAGAVVSITHRKPLRELVTQPGSILASIVAGTFGWMAVSGLVSWGDATRWLVGRPQAALVLLIVSVCACLAMREDGDGASESASRLMPLDWIAIAVLALFGFRTFPIVEFYHWGFYIGPMEQLRQGGQLLWDTPSQYGLLSILIPTIMPGTAWESFWFFQSVIFAVVAAIMYVGIRRMGRGMPTTFLSFALVFTTLFFRPRTATLLLPAQMTPSGGPVRFIPMFLLLAWLMRGIVGISAGMNRADTTQKPGDETRFVVGGSALWIFAVLWSAEAGIYCSAIWFSALAIYLFQAARKWRAVNRRGPDVAGQLTKLVSIPVAFALIAFLAVEVVARAVASSAPDLHGYIEYALLYSKGGFGALPIDPTGSVWFLLLIFFAISTAVALYLASDLDDRRLVMLAALWGGAWSVGSYFTGRSHPVNVLSIAPILLYSASLMLRTLRSDREAAWHPVLRAAMVPAFIMPVVLTMAHGRALAEITRPQLAPSAITDQVPAMDTSLASLLKQQGARVTDPMALIADGRLMLPAWREGNRTEMSERSWLPKPYEIIGSLPEARRNVYIARDAATTPEGWLIHSKTDTIAGYADLHAKLLEGRTESRRGENGNWIVSWIGKAAR